MVREQNMEYFEELFHLLCQLKKKHNKSKFSWLALLFKIKIQPNMREQKKKRQRIYDLLNAETKPKSLCIPYTKPRKASFFLLKKSFWRKRESEGVKKTEQKAF